MLIFHAFCLCVRANATLYLESVETNNLLKKKKKKKKKVLLLFCLTHFSVIAVPKYLLLTRDDNYITRAMKKYVYVFILIVTFYASTFDASPSSDFDLSYVYICIFVYWRMTLLIELLICTDTSHAA